MIKTLLTSLLLFAPAISRAINTNYSQNSPVLHEKVTIKSVESDEFILYWKDDFRKDENDNIIAICDISYSDYQTMYSKYVLLTSEDRQIVDATPDYESGYTIKDSIKELVGNYQLSI